MTWWLLVLLRLLRVEQVCQKMLLQLKAEAEVAKVAAGEGQAELFR